MKILLIGGSKGLGQIIYEKLGYFHSIITMSRHSTEYTLDLNWSEEKIQKAVKKAIRDLGGCDVLIVSSGYTKQTGPLVPEAEAQKLLKINYLGPMVVYKTVLRSLLKSKGKAIFVSSTVVRKPSASWLAHYAASKGALEAWAIPESKRAAEHGIGVCVVRPGWFNEGMADGLRCDTKRKAAKAIPFKRFGERKEIAEFISSLLYQSNWVIAGSVYEMTGGA
jgi:3-oxoacyl-[acyl-carrier protein] reductase